MALVVPKVRCHLCQRFELLRRSHIVPEFFYRQMYDEKHRALVIDTKTDASRLIQKGIREELLCHDCEQFLNDRYEQPFLREWRDGDMVPQQLFPGQFHRVRVDYARVKLFLLSVLFRADVSSLSTFGSVTLGPHRERLRQMILGEDPGSPTEYNILPCVAADDDGSVFHTVGSPASYRIKGRRGYAFLFGGFEWIFFVTGNPVPQVERTGLRPDGLMLCKALRLEELHTGRAIRRHKVTVGPADSRSLRHA